MARRPTAWLRLRAARRAGVGRCAAVYSARLTRAAIVRACFRADQGDAVDAANDLARRHRRQQNSEGRHATVESRVQNGPH